MKKTILQQKASMCKKAWNNAIYKIHALEREIELRIEKRNKDKASGKDTSNLQEDINRHKWAKKIWHARCKDWKKKTLIVNKQASNEKQGY